MRWEEKRKKVVKRVPTYILCASQENPVGVSLHGLQVLFRKFKLSDNDDRTKTKQTSWGGPFGRNCFDLAESHDGKGVARVDIDVDHLD